MSSVFAKQFLYFSWPATENDNVRKLLIWVTINNTGLYFEINLKWNGKWSQECSIFCIYLKYHQDLSMLKRRLKTNVKGVRFRFSFNSFFVASGYLLIYSLMNI